MGSLAWALGHLYHVKYSHFHKWANKFFGPGVLKQKMFHNCRGKRDRKCYCRLMLMCPGQSCGYSLESLFCPGSGCSVQ